MRVINTPTGEDEGGMLMPPAHRLTGGGAADDPPAGAKPPKDTGTPAFHDPENVKGRGMEPAGGHRFGPQARATAVTLPPGVLQICRIGPDGLPALPASNQQALKLTHIDPEGRGRSIGQQLDDLLAQAERQSLEEWKGS